MGAVAGGERYDVIVVGAGISGMYALERLRRLGLSVRVLEAADDVGGTWYWNRYPGARCDIESMTYSYSWSDELQQEWSWSERYAGQPEILRYLGHVADRFDLRRDIAFGTRMAGAAFDEGTSRWAVSTEAGDLLSASFLIMATGCLSVPVRPRIPGLERFSGELYHTGRWPHAPVTFAGKRVCVIGTGSSAVQSIPVIAQEADQVTVFQRTPPYSVPAWNGPLDADVERAWKARYPERRRIARESAGGNPWHGREARAVDATPDERSRELEARYRVGGFYLHSAYSDIFTDARANELVAEFVRGKIRERVHDASLAELLCPRDYPFATKRMCIDTGYYEAYNRDNVRLVDASQAPIDEVSAGGIRAGGTEHEADVLVLASGFDAMTGALLGVDLRGRSGVPLRRAWANGPRTYLGLTVSGFPNLFAVTGPGSPSVLSNMMVSIEQHVDWICDCIAHLGARGAERIEAGAGAERAWLEHVRALGEETLYPRARSWYMGANIPGKPRVLLPYVGGVGRYREECRRVAEAGYEGFEVGGRRPAFTSPA